MPSQSSPEDTLDWFIRGFTARDLAEPLLSVDERAEIATARELITSRGASVLGIRRDGLIARWINAADVTTAGDLYSGAEFANTQVVAENTPLSDVVCLLNTEERLFVRALGQVAGVIPRAAIVKPPLRMWLFGMITISEQRVTSLIEELFPDDAWLPQISPGRQNKARELQVLRQNRGQQPTLLDCLQFADKGQIVARNESLRERTRFRTRAGVERFVQALQDLRNNLAHSQDISGDWDVIHELAANVHRIICGPSSPATNAG